MHKTLRALACFYWLFASALLAAQDRHLYTIALRHATPEQIVPALQPQLSEGSSLGSYGQQLILNATAAEYRQIGSLLEQLDRSPRSLIITVRGQEQADQQEQRYAIENRPDNPARIRAGGPSHETRVVVNQGTQQNHRDGAQQVRAVEGMAAFISSGNTYSMRGGYAGQRELTPVTSGFYATVRVLDHDEIVVDIDQKDQRLSSRRSIDTQALQTRVRGRIGEWIALGGIDSARSGDSRTLSGYSATNSSSSRDIAIRVDLAE